MSEPLPESNHRGHRGTLFALTLLALVALLVVFQSGLRALAVETWRELRGISPAWLALIIPARIGQAIFSAISWRNALNAAFPNYALPYRFMLGLDQGQDALNTVTPARSGTITLIAALRITIRGATTPRLLGVLALQNLPFFVFGVILAGILAIGLPDRAGDENRLWSDAIDAARRYPLATAVIVTLVVIVAGVALYLSRSRIDDAWQELREGVALLGSPVAFVRLIGAPAFISYVFRWIATLALLGAFGIPVTFWTGALAVGSSAASGAIRVTPGGIGPTQALDVIALSAYAPPETVTAFSLAGLAVSVLVSTSLALFGLLGSSRSKRVRVLLRARRRPKPA